MNTVLTFDTGGELSHIYQGIPHIPESFIRSTADSLLPSTITHLNESAVICGIVLDTPFNQSSSPQQRLIRAFTDGGIVALGAARTELRRRHDELGVDNDEFTEIEQMFVSEQIGPFVSDKGISVQVERNGRVKSATEHYGSHASTIIRILRTSYGMESQQQEDDSLRKTIAALGFAVVAPQIDRAVSGFITFKTQLEEMLKG